MRSLGRLTALFATLALTALAAAAPAAQARDDTVTSFDGTKIAVSLLPGGGPSARAAAPDRPAGPRLGQLAATDENAVDGDLFGQVGLGPLRQAGFNVLTWDARGWGQSSGTIEVDSAGAEARDVQALLT